LPLFRHNQLSPKCACFNALSQFCPQSPESVSLSDELFMNR
jgi:hypothetical protein